MKELELKPCPFCGHAAHVREFVQADGTVLFCIACGTEGCPGSDSLALHRTVEFAAGAWNRRAGRAWRDFADELPPSGRPVLCMGRNGALYVGKPVEIGGRATREVWVPRGDQYRRPERWMEVDE